MRSLPKLGNTQQHKLNSPMHIIILRLIQIEHTPCCFRPCCSERKVSVEIGAKQAPNLVHEAFPNKATKRKRITCKPISVKDGGNSYKHTHTRILYIKIIIYTYTYITYENRMFLRSKKICFCFPPLRCPLFCFLCSAKFCAAQFICCSRI